MPFFQNRSPHIQALKSSINLCNVEQRVVFLRPTLWLYSRNECVFGQRLNGVCLKRIYPVAYRKDICVSCLKGVNTVILLCCALRRILITMSVPQQERGQTLKHAMIPSNVYTHPLWS